MSSPITLKVKGATQNAEGAYVINDQTRFVVGIPKAHKWLFESSLFEVTFYDNYQFVEEAEYGYVPFSWKPKFDTLASGKHIFTVNLSGYDGQMGTASVVYYKSE